MTRRAKRVAELVRHELGRILAEELGDPRIGFVTVAAVEMSADLRTATVSVSVLGEPGKRRAAIRGLESALPHIRSLLGRKLGLRRVPEIMLRLDEGVQRSVRINTILTQLARGRGGGEAPAAENSDDREEKNDDAVE